MFFRVKLFSNFVKMFEKITLWVVQWCRRDYFHRRPPQCKWTHDSRLLRGAKCDNTSNGQLFRREFATWHTSTNNKIFLTIKIIKQSKHWVLNTYSKWHIISLLNFSKKYLFVVSRIDETVAQRFHSLTHYSKHMKGLQVNYMRRSYGRIRRHIL